MQVTLYQCDRCEAESKDAAQLGLQEVYVKPTGAKGAPKKTKAEMCSSCLVELGIVSQKGSARTQLRAVS